MLPNYAVFLSLLYNLWSKCHLSGWTMYPVSSVVQNVLFFFCKFVTMFKCPIFIRMKDHVACQLKLKAVKSKVSVWCIWNSSPISDNIWPEPEAALDFSSTGKAPKHLTSCVSSKVSWLKHTWYRKKITAAEIYRSLALLAIKSSPLYFARHFLYFQTFAWT